MFLSIALNALINFPFFSHSNIMAFTVVSKVILIFALYLLCVINMTPSLYSIFFLYKMS